MRCSVVLFLTSCSSRSIERSPGIPDHLPLLLDIPLKVFWPAGKKSIAPDSDEEADFLGEIIVSLGNIMIPGIVSGDQTQAVATAIAKVFEEAWTHFAKTKQACSRSKSWWDRGCAEMKAAAMASDLPADWSAFKKAARAAKRKHFDARIDKIAVKNLFGQMSLKFPLLWSSPSRGSRRTTLPSRFALLCCLIQWASCSRKCSPTVCSLKLRNMVFSIPTSLVGFVRTLLRMLDVSYRMLSAPDGMRASK
jgi:hypothetical protein